MSIPISPEEKNSAAHDYVGEIITKHIRENFNPIKDRILDVGAGWNKYPMLLPEFEIDAVEAYEQNKKHLVNFDNVFIANILDFPFKFYSIIIMSDVLEHIEETEAKELIKRLVEKCNQIYVAVPYLFEQGELYGNKYEIHRQPDLTPAIMNTRYPQLKLLEGNDRKGVYIKK